MSSPAKRIAELRDQIAFHDFKYYQEARPVISDREYDRLMQELLDLERQHPDLVSPDSPTQRVGGDVQTELKPVRHAVPMMSIDNTYSEAEIRAFDERVRRGLGGEQPAYVLEPKIDGTSISLRYEDGRLVLAATRGRGNVGDDVTVNARTIKAIPLRLRSDGKTKPPPVVEIRGEVYMDNDDFQRVNKEIEATGEEPYANPRNLTSGTLRRLDPKIVARRRLRFLAHGLGQVEPLPVETYWQWTRLIHDWGIPQPETWRVETVDEAIERIHEFEKLRPQLPYTTDGMVVKVDSFAHRERLGATSKSPRWVVAYKYETEQQPTVLKNVRWQVGKGGNLTPVGELEPVFIGGVTVTNVTLHNIDQIKRLDLHLGDTVVVERAGEVIPYVVEALPDKRPKHAKPIEAPTICSSCGEKVEREADTPYIRCTNPDCPGQLRERLIWFAGRGQMEIDGLGEKIIDQLIGNGLVSSYADIYRLEAEQLAELTHDTTVGEATAQTIVKSLAEAHEKWASFRGPANECSSPPDELKPYLEKLGKKLRIKKLGEKTIAQLLDSGLVRSPDDLFALSVEQIANLPRQVKLGEQNAGRIVKSIQGSKSRGLARVLAALGIRLVGATAARAFAEWAGNIKTLQAATTEELAGVLAKDPEAKKLSADKEKQSAEALHGSLHGGRQRDLFNSEENVAAAAEAQSSEDFLKARDEQLSRTDRLGARRIRRIVECFPTFDEMASASSNDLFECLIEGAAVARSLHEYLHSDHGARVIESLRKEGVKLSEAVTEKKDSEWTGKTVVITGSFEGYTRDQIKERLISLGAKVSDSVSSKTHLVLVGDEPGSKYDKAVALNVPVGRTDTVEKLMKS